MNVSSLKTPGVYINEIDAFPPSVANVATAIPAFVGYTEKGPSEPTRISSMLEYEQLFGGAPQPANITIVLDENNLPTDASEVKESKFKLYNSLNLFYANGGGVCYIVSIGNYLKPDKSVNNIAKDHFFKDGDNTVGLGKLEKKDEVTLLLFPDAINLDANDLGEVQKAALAQCEKLMDRFVIMDVLQKDGLIQDALNFRDGVGNSSLKYGASYYPYLRCNYTFKPRFSQINGLAEDKKIDFLSIYKEDSKNKEDKEINKQLKKFNDLYKKVYNVDAITPSNNGYKEAWKLLFEVEKVSISDDFTNTKTYVDLLWNFLQLLGKLDSLESNFKAYVTTTIKTKLVQYAQRLVDFKDEYDGLKVGDDDVEKTNDLPTDAKFDLSIWGVEDAGDYKFKTSDEKLYDGQLESEETEGLADRDKIQAALDKLYNQIVAGIEATILALENYVEEEENNLVTQIPIYPQIIAKLSVSFNTLPPSGAMAGIYAKVDATRGVWKSPANVSVNGIVGLTDDINDADQMDMNVHETGKSINAIRYFTGKGFLVWGGRTLAGNSNDWRYINVRRLANMIEESTKKSCMHFVFEPNVSQTWVNLKGMIENYLTTLWNDGALAGSKPEHAFFVQVGLGQTMTSQDINEGRLIVKIGYAPSKPAEFIILEFKQMQQRS